MNFCSQNGTQCTVSYTDRWQYLQIDMLCKSKKDNQFWLAASKWLPLERSWGLPAA
jgi:hypothetical protein